MRYRRAASPGLVPGRQAKALGVFRPEPFIGSGSFQHERQLRVMYSWSSSHRAPIPVTLIEAALATPG